jgi:hypothetical protein
MKPVIFALLTDDEDALPGLGPLTPAVKETLIILGALLIVIGGVLFWALVLRRRKRRSSDRHRRRHRKSAVKSAAAGVSEIKQLIRERQRRRHREHRPRNPTLAETGGLPPSRSAAESGPPAAPTQT